MNRLIHCNHVSIVVLAFVIGPGFSPGTNPNTKAGL